MSTKAAVIAIPKQLHFTVYATPEPQGSIRAFIVPNKQAVAAAVSRIRSGQDAYKTIFAACRATHAALTSDNPDLKKFRDAVAAAAKKEMWARDMDGLLAGKHVPVELVLDFWFERPESAKKRQYPVVRPDLDKLCRSTIDAMSEVVIADDSQVVKLSAEKHYGTPERVEVSVSLLDARLF